MDLNEESIRILRTARLSWVDIADILGISRSKLYRFRISLENFVDPYAITPIVDDGDRSEVCRIIKKIQNAHPGRGERILMGTLHSTHNLRIPRKLLREVINEVDPGGRACRMDSQYQHTLVNSRQKYSVPGPGYIWHVDTYHKLGNFGFVVFGAIDGFSHECICLETSTNNLAMTALDALFPKFSSYGIPKFIMLKQTVLKANII
jgi:hypothetical protein